MYVINVLSIVSTPESSSVLGYLNLKALSHFVYNTQIVLRVQRVVNKVTALFDGSTFLQEYLLLMHLHYLCLGDSYFTINVV
jgi:hypothetical protein